MTITILDRAGNVRYRYGSGSIESFRQSPLNNSEVLIVENELLGRLVACNWKYIKLINCGAPEISITIQSAEITVVNSIIRINNNDRCARITLIPSGHVIIRLCTPASIRIEPGPSLYSCSITPVIWECADIEYKKYLYITSLFRLNGINFGRDHIAMIQCGRERYIKNSARGKNIFISYKFLHSLRNSELADIHRGKRLFPAPVMKYPRRILRYYL